MIDRLPAHLEYNAHELFGSIVGSFVYDTMPDFYTPNDAPPEFVEALVGIPVPIRFKLVGLTEDMVSIRHPVPNALLELQQNKKNVVTFYNEDVLEELGSLGLHGLVDQWGSKGWMKISIPVYAGILEPLHRPLAA